MHIKIGIPAMLGKKDEDVCLRRAEVTLTTDVYSTALDRTMSCLDAHTAFLIFQNEVEALKPNHDRRKGDRRK